MLRQSRFLNREANNDTSLHISITIFSCRAFDYSQRFLQKEFGEQLPLQYIIATENADTLRQIGPSPFVTTKIHSVCQCFEK